MIQGRLPDSIYRSLPYFYTLAGVLTIFLANNGFAVFSGVTLITAGAIVFLVRNQYREKPQGSKREAKGQKSEKEVSNQDFIELRWRKSFESGHSLLDEQHGNLFVLCNRLINKVLNDEPREDIHSLFKDIKEHVVEHFRTEESVLNFMNHPMAASHKEIHTMLISKFEALFERFQSGQMPTKDIVGFIIYDLVTDHLMKEDICFFEDLSAKVGQMGKSFKQN